MTYELEVSFVLFKNREMIVEGVVAVCKMVIDTTKRIQALERNDIDAMVAAGAGSEGIAFIRFLLTQPVVQVKDIEKNLGVSYTKANKLRSLAEELEIVSQISAGTRNRKYSYHTYISILSEGTEMVVDQGL